MWKLIFAVLLICGLNALNIDENNILLYFYSPGKSNVKSGQPLNRSQFHTAKVTTTNDVKVIIHGHGTDSKYSSSQSIVDAYLTSGEHNNIVFLDWSKYSTGSYIDLYTVKEEIAEIMAKDLIGFSKGVNIPLKMFHLIGISYGGQLAGLVGQQIYEETGSKLTRITGLNPTGPLFIGAPENARLDATDAIFVDVIHTYLFLGYFQACGTVDFWPNGGHFQRGCDLLSPCSENRATEYFTESINNKNFTAWECFDQHLFNLGLCEEGNCISMGEHANTSAKGQYFLHTNPQSPYACMC